MTDTSKCSLDERCGECTIAGKNCEYPQKTPGTSIAPRRKTSVTNSPKLARPKNTFSKDSSLRAGSSSQTTGVKTVEPSHSTTRLGKFISTSSTPTKALVRPRNATKTAVDEPAFSDITTLRACDNCIRQKLKVSAFYNLWWNRSSSQLVRFHQAFMFEVYWK